MPMFSYFRRRDEWEEYNEQNQSSPTCSHCGCVMHKKQSDKTWYCPACKDANQTMKVSDAASIWLASGKDSEYMYGFSEEELEAEL